MTPGSTPVLKDLVLVGGGHSHVIVLRRFGMKPMPGVRVTVICRDVETPYSGMLPGHVAGHYTHDEIHIDLGPLARFANARFYHDEVVGIDPAENLVICRNRPAVRYDVLSIDVGSAPRVHHVPGADGTVVPVKPIGNFVARWNALVERVLGTGTRMRIGVVGAGAGGVEMVLAMRHGLRDRIRRTGGDPERLSFEMFTDTAGVLPSKPPRVRAAFDRVLTERGVRVHRNARIERVTRGSPPAAGSAVDHTRSGHGSGSGAVAAGIPVESATGAETEGARRAERATVLHAADGTAHELDEVLWVTEAGAQDWLAAAGLATGDGGFVAVHPTLESTSHPGIFAAGDCAAVLAHPREKAGVFAVRQGPPLDENLRRALCGRALKPFTPQRRYLSLISTGERRAVATRGGLLVLDGQWVWRWKDWIDRRFMRKFADLPEMSEDTPLDLPGGLAGEDAVRELSAIAMRCGGCGAKVGATVLARAMDRIEPVDRDDVLLGLDDPDDAAVVETPPGKVVVHTVDAFRAMIDDPYRFGRIAANHSLGDIFAMGGEPQTALAIATLPHGIETQVEDTLRQMMTGASEVLRDAGAALVGGHTSEGAELSLGFAVSGLVDRDRILRKGGMRPGDRLLITKPLGTGTLFAADMRHRARGAWIAEALDVMQQSNRDGARCLRRHGASACTDVTGFGLLGHLVEMIRASEVDVELDLGTIPFLPGALETITAGITSSLQPQNLRLRRAVRDADAAANDPRWPILFDPQTAGGLLACVAGGEAESCVDELRAFGYAYTALIGRVSPRSNALEPITLLR